MRNLAICIGLLLALVASAQAVSWSAYVSPNNSTDTWSIYREGLNMSFDYSQAVDGIISPVDYHGRMLSPYHSGYSELQVSDVRMRERTAALEGMLSSEEILSLESKSWKPVYMNLSKPGGSPVWTVKFMENWQSVLKANKTLEYSGRNINDREFVGNNYDYAGATLLYNKELSKEQGVYLNLTRMNATVVLTDEELLYADFMPTREMEYQLSAHTTGIADLKYGNSGFRETSDYDARPSLLEGSEERYVGTYDIMRRIRMASNFTEIKELDDWMPCCSAGWANMNPMERKYWGAQGIFDCSCYKPPLPI